MRDGRESNSCRSGDQWVIDSLLPMIAINLNLQTGAPINPTNSMAKRYFRQIGSITLTAGSLLSFAMSANAIDVQIVAERGAQMFAFDVVWGDNPTSTSDFEFGQGSLVAAFDDSTSVSLRSYYGDPFPTPLHSIVIDFALSSDQGRSFERGDLVGASGVRVFPLSGTQYGARFLYPIGVPDGGQSVAMFGAGLIGVSLFRGWFARR